MVDRNRRAQIYMDLREVAGLIFNDCEDYLKVYTSWDKARRAMDDFMDNPDWLEKWVNDIEKVEVCSE